VVATEVRERPPEVQVQASVLLQPPVAEALAR
jgi:hypothetical protein